MVPLVESLSYKFSMVLKSSDSWGIWSLSGIIVAIYLAPRVVVFYEFSPLLCVSQTTLAATYLGYSSIKYAE